MMHFCVDCFSVHTVKGVYLIRFDLGTLSRVALLPLSSCELAIT
jgi:hypothetical protein